MITGAVNSKKVLTGKINNATEYIYPTLENIEITPTKEEQIFNHPDSDGYDEVRVNGVTSAIDTNIIPENIKENVSILGVKGTFAGAKYKPRYIMFDSYKGTELQEEINNLDTSLLTELGDMFMSCSKLISLDFSNHVFGKIVSLSRTFYGCSKLTSLDLSSWDTSECDNMSNTFYGCSALTELDLSNFVSDNVYIIDTMFSGCKNLMRLDMRNFKFSTVTRYSQAFNNVPTNCLIIVKDSTEKAWLQSKFSSLTNIKTVAEIGG